MNNFLTSNTNSESILHSENHTYFQRESCGSTISMVIKLQTGQLINCGSISGRDTNLFSSPKHPDRLEANLISHSIGYRGASSGGKVVTS